MPTDTPAQPLYKRVKSQLIERLREGHWRFGAALPSEEALAHEFCVSIGTMRRALGELTDENILERRQGRGTFVVTHTRDYMLNVFFQIMDGKGRKELPRSEMLSFSRARVDAATAAQLSLPRGAPAFCVEALLRLQGEPAILDLIWLPQSLFPDLNAQILANRDGTLFGLYQMRYGITVLHITEKITAEIAEPRIRERLRLPEPAAVLRIVRTAYTHRDQPVETRTRYVSTRKHHYLSVLGRRAGAGDASY